jgi:phosphatidylinositol alpha-1,6-mannosyltransferase
MHILIVSHYTLPHVGGIEVCVDQLSRALARDGHEVTVVSSRAGASPVEWRDGVRILRVAAWNGLERSLHVPFPIFAPSLLTSLWRATRRADVVHVHGVLCMSSLCALFCAWWMGKPLVVTEHVGFVPYKSQLLNTIERIALAIAAPLFLRRADAMIALNDRVRDWLARSSPYPERLHILPNGIDTARFRPASAEERKQARLELELASDRRLVVFVGRFVQKKGLDCLLQIPDGTFDVLMCGSGEFPAAPRPAGVHVVRNLPHESMPDVYRAGDVLVLPSCGEGFPLSVMEAMACGLPVVAARDTVYDRYVSEGEMVQTEPNPASMRAAVRWLLEDGNEHMRRSRAARARALSSFGLTASVAGHLRLYERARVYRRLSNELSLLGTDLATRLKVPVLRSLLTGSEDAPCVDIGPGSGYTAHHVFPPGPIVVLDLSHDNLRALCTAAAEAGCPERFLPVQADLTALPFRHGSLGNVLCAEVLEHIENDQQAAAELIRTLAPNGALIVEVPNASRGYASYLERLGVRTVHDVPGPEFHQRPGYTPESLAELFRPSGGRLGERRFLIGFVAQALIDAVAAAHLVYERLCLGRSSWTWSDVKAVARSPVFRIYRAVFPFLLLLARLEALFVKRTGFTLAARFEKRKPDEQGPAQ